MSSAIAPRPPAAAAPALTERSFFNRLHFALSAFAEHSNGWRARRWAFGSTHVLHAVVGSVVTLSVLAELHAVVRATVPEGTSLAAPGRRLVPDPFAHKRLSLPFILAVLAISGPHEPRLELTRPT